MSTVDARLQTPPPGLRPRAPARSVPRVFQGLLIAYVLLTGELVRGVQAALFGLQGGGEAAFTAGILLAIAVDVARIGPLFVYSRHPLGVLHPLILTTVLWPLLIAMPGRIEEFWGLGGLLLGDPISPPLYQALGWLPGPQIWSAVAWSNLCQLTALLATYAGYALTRERNVQPGMERPRRPRKEFDGKRLRTLAIALVVLSIGVLLVLIELRGGLSMHLSDMARGRFRSMAGLGPLIAAVDLGVIALIVWVAARPGDVRQPLFVAIMAGVAAAQFISNGARSAAFAVFMVIALTWALRTRRIPWRLAAIMLPLFFLAFGALNIVRTAGFVGQTGGEAIQESSPGQVLSRVQEEIDLRQSLQSTVPVISQGHEVMGGPLWGSSYAAAVFAFVPRAIWPDKPRGPGSLYAQNFLGEVREGLAVPVNPTAEAYWNFGFLGVIFLSALYGSLIRYAHNFYTARQENPFVLGAFVLFVTSFHISTDDLVAMQIAMALLLFVLGLALIFAVRIGPGVTVPPGQRPSLGPPLPLR